MLQANLSTTFSLAVILGCSACTAADTLNKADKMQEAVESVGLVAAIEAADTTIANSNITFYVANNSDTEVTILTWNTPLERELSADIFTVTRDGVPVEYQGRMVKRSAPSKKDYLAIAPRERVESLVDMAVYYDMAEPGEYLISFSPVVIDGQARLNEQTPVMLVESSVSVLIEP